MAVAVPIIAAVVATAATVYSTVSSSQAQAKSERGTKRRERLIAEQSRLAAQQRASDEEKRHRRLIAAGRARYAASGVEAEGTPLLVEMESLRESEEQLRRIREGGEVEYMTGMELAKAAGQRAQSSLTSGYVSAAGYGASSLYNVGRTYDWW